MSQNIEVKYQIGFITKLWQKTYTRVSKENDRQNIRFISMRFSGIDGATLESSKWTKIMKKMVIAFSGSPVN